MKNKVNQVNKSIYKQTQKGNISLIKRKGNMYNNSYIGLKFNKPTSLTEVQLKALKAYINLYIGKNIEKIWNINPKISRCKRQGVRMGKGKSKIDHYIYRYPISSIFILFNNVNKDNNSTQLNNILYNKYSLNKLERGLIKIKLKFTFLSITKNIIKH